MADTSGNLSKLDANQVLRLSYDDDKNRLRVGAEITASIADIDVHIDSASGDNISIASADGLNPMIVNPDGSINVVADIMLDQAQDSVAIGDGTTLAFVDPATHALLVTLNNTNLTTKNIFNEIINIVNGITSIIISYTAIANTKLLRCDFGGDNIAVYSLYIGGNIQAKKYTYYTNLNEMLEFISGLPITTGDLIQIEVIHNRPNPGTFYCNMLIEN